MTNKSSLIEIEKAIQNSNAEVQERLLNDLPHLLKIATADLGLLRISEKSFDFWNNPDDIIYDNM